MELRDVLRRLRRAYGDPPPPPVTGAWPAVVWENVAYLVDDERRGRAFAALESRVGLAPQAILAADDEVLAEVAKLGGMRPGDRVAKLRRCAEIVIEEHGGDLDAVVAGPVTKARRALQRYPGIGRPGADTILLHAGRFDGLPLESNGLRVLVRLGFAAEGRSYDATYRAVRDAIADQLPRTTAARVRARALLRIHGQRTCKQTPRCEGCLLQGPCPRGHG